MVECLLQAAQMLQAAEDRMVPQMHSSTRSDRMAPNTSVPIVYFQQPPPQVMYNHNRQTPGPAYQYGHPAVGHAMTRMNGFRVGTSANGTTSTSVDGPAGSMKRMYPTPKITRTRQNPSSIAQKKPVPIMIQKSLASSVNKMVPLRSLTNLGGSKKPDSKLSPAMMMDDATNSDDATDDDCSPGKDGRMRTNVAHNEVEKRRRAYLTACYNDLHNILPTISGTKASNATVLRSAVEHIKALKAEDKVYVAAKKELLAERKRILDRKSRTSKASMALQKRRLEIEQGTHVKPPTIGNVPESFACDDSSNDEEGLVPDSYSRPVSPNLSPKEDLTLLGSPITKKTKRTSKGSKRSHGAPIKLAALL
eukprot:m.31966 g.31966  ORF g.31966 m.31966 type:complete len:364 (-) comp16562_c0_seq1:463-1554(-)